MAKRINPAKALLWRNATDVQLGIENPLILRDVTPEDERLLNLLQRGIPDDSVTEAQKNLIERIAPALVDFGVVKKPRLSHEFMQGAFAELIKASFATDRDGVSVLEARAGVTVQLDSLGNGGLLLARGLAAAGVGRIISEDSNRVTAQEVNPLGYRKIQTGMPRIEAAQQLLSESHSAMRLDHLAGLTPAKRKHLLKVLITGSAIDPRRFRELVDRNLPHLCVFFEPGRVSVSPVISSSACLGCLDLERTETDPAWPAIASQVIGRVDYLEDARSALFAAAMVVGEVLRAIDSPERERDFVGHRLDVVSGRVTEWSWPRRLDCYCAGSAARI